MVKKDGGWRIPATIEPDDYIEFCIRIPNELGHIIAFWGNMENLGRWFNWERDDNKSALACSLVWREYIEYAREQFILREGCGSAQGGDTVTAEDIRDGMILFLDYLCTCGDSDDPTPEEPPGPSPQEIQNSATTGGFYRVLLEMDTLARQADAQIAGGATTENEIVEPILNVYGDFIDATFIRQWAQLILGAGGASFITQADTIVETAYCAVGDTSRRVRAGLNEVYSGSNLAELLNLILAFTDPFLQSLMDVGQRQPRDEWRGYACVSRPPVRLVLVTDDGSADDSVRASGAVIPDDRLYEVRISGRATLSDGTVIDALYEVEPNGTINNNPLRVSGVVSFTTAQSMRPPQDERPPYNENGVYVWRVAMIGATNAQLDFLVEEERKDLYGTGDTATFTIELVDLGEVL